MGDWLKLASLALHLHPGWHIALEHPEGTHLVSFDDDIPEVFEKVRPGTSSDTMQPLEPWKMVMMVVHSRIN